MGGGENRRKREGSQARGLIILGTKALIQALAQALTSWASKYPMSATAARAVTGPTPETWRGGRVSGYCSWQSCSIWRL